MTIPIPSLNVPGKWYSRWNVSYGIKIGWLRGSFMRVFCDKRISTKVKDKFYKTIVSPIVLMLDLQGPTYPQDKYRRKG